MYACEYVSELGSQLVIDSVSHHSVTQSIGKSLNQNHDSS